VGDGGGEDGQVGRHADAVRSGRPLPARQLAVEHAVVEAAGAEVVVAQDQLEERRRGADAVDAQLGQGALKARDRPFPVAAPDDQLGHHRVVVDRDLGALVDAAVVAHAGALGQAQHVDAARRGREALVGILGVQTHLDGVAAGLGGGVLGAELLALGHAELRDHQVEAGHQLGDRVLDLEAGVHLQEVEASALVEQELHGAGADVARGPRGAHRRLAHAPPQAGVDGRRRRLLEHLLVAALQRALALAEREALPVVVGQHLDLDVARALDELLEVDGVVAEARGGLGARRAVGLGQLLGAAHQAHSLAAAARRRLEHHRVADLLGGAARRVHVGQRIMAPGHHGYAGLEHQAPAFDLRAHGRHGRGRRPDEGHAALGAGAGEAGVLRQEAVAGVDGVGADRERQVEDGVAFEVALARRRGADAVGLVGEQHRQAGAVGVGVDHGAAGADLAQGPQHPHRDLAAVGHQDLTEGSEGRLAHRRARRGAS